MNGAVLRALDRTVEFLLLALLAGLVLIGGLQIVWRFVLDSPLAWVLEVSVIGMVWATMLSGYVGVRRNTHLSADFLGLAMRPSARWWLDLLNVGLCVVFLAVYGWTSLDVIDAMDGIPFTSIPLEQPALYWALPAGAVLMALAFGVRLFEHTRQRPKAF
ncbi:MAG: TRAP transporter small permease [Rubrivivax sp.]|nr:TRAP transporter small permease [Rubrivivax sp.]